MCVCTYIRVCVCVSYAGVHNDKGQRARVHQAVRLSHPVLKTETIKSDKVTGVLHNDIH